MKQEIAQAWVADLRANPDKQGKGALTILNPDGSESHCCLGRLQELALAEGVCHRKPLNQPNFAEYVTYEDNAADDIGYVASDALVCTWQVQEWAGLGTGNPGIAGLHLIRKDDENRHAYTLAELNDSGYTFDEIAAIIEVHWRGL